ncbi:hypothetical protein EJ06DRAFT_526365 [Trichodelitschia bisporula]|uniref:Secreted protein n=1 Tax=Trichodelitschia bisporula TaxID=703511 RepID=A0A6G1I7P3_9PEZI|nr:hypothetical protein EJ06DRAFT_526365 [Trichodelitschia bisporula]
MGPRYLHRQLFLLAVFTPCCPPPSCGTAASQESGIPPRMCRYVDGRPTSLWMPLAFSPSVPRVVCRVCLLTFTPVAIGIAPNSKS